MVTSACDITGAIGSSTVLGFAASLLAAEPSNCVSPTNMNVTALPLPVHVRSSGATARAEPPALKPSTAAEAAAEPVGEATAVVGAAGVEPSVDVTVVVVVTGSVIGLRPVMSTVEDGSAIVGAVSGTVVDAVVLVVETFDESSRVRSYATVIVTPASVSARTAPSRVEIIGST